jgi:hypothetical protein
MLERKLFCHPTGEADQRAIKCEIHRWLTKKEDEEFLFMHIHRFVKKHLGNNPHYTYTSKLRNKTFLNKHMKHWLVEQMRELQTKQVA